GPKRWCGQARGRTCRSGAVCWAPPGRSRWTHRPARSVRPAKPRGSPIRRTWRQPRWRSTRRTRARYWHLGHGRTGGFGGRGGGAVPKETAGGPRLPAGGRARLPAPAPAGAAAANQSPLSPPASAPSYFEMEGSWQPPAGPGRAAELWFLSEAIDHASLIALV